jgi:predicted HTH domain antitoxin
VCAFLGLAMPAADIRSPTIRDKPSHVRYLGAIQTVDVKVPSELLRAANLEQSTLSQEAARLLALELYRGDKVSLGRAAELSQTPVAAFMDFAAKHGVPPLRYSFEDLEEERRTADRLKA